MKAKDVYTSVIQLFTLQFTGLKADVKCRKTVRLVLPPNIEPVSDEVLEDMAVALLAKAAASGKNLTIENKGVPEYGMGGYASQVRIRPDYRSVREKLDALPPATLKRERPPLQFLKAQNIPWDGSSIRVQNNVLTDPAHLSHHELVELVREYDRRLMQMWDKVGFERQHELVNYNQLQPQAESAYDARTNSGYTNASGI